MSIDTYQGGFNIYPVSRGLWQASAGWSVPGEESRGQFVAEAEKRWRD